MQGAADILRQSKKVIGIGSPRASIEIFALQAFRRSKETIPVSPRASRRLLVLKVLRGRRYSYPSAAKKLDPMMRYWLGEDLTQTGASRGSGGTSGGGSARMAAQKADWRATNIDCGDLTS